MSSLVVEYASVGSDCSHDHEENDRSFDLLRATDRNAHSLSFPAEIFLKAAISLKDQAVEMTWMRQGNNASLDPTVYSGLLGTAFTCLRSYEATANLRDLRLCAQIVDACAAAVAHAASRHVTFLCGHGGVYALGAVAANYRGDQQKRDFYLDCFLEMAQEKALPVGPQEGGFGMSYDLLYGRAGFLWAALFINEHIQGEPVPNDLLMPVVDAVFAGGRAGSHNTACPLMYRWHGTRYFGAAHGLAGILHILLHFPLSGGDMDDVKATLRYMMSNRFSHSGNYPVSEGNPRDKLVQWAHGATGVAITLCKASKVLPNDREFRDAAIEAGEVVWKNGLVGKMGLEDGTAGNAYAFLSLYRLTGDRVYEERAKAFASSLFHNVRSKMNEKPPVDGPDHTYSLFQGLSGVACLWLDLLAPDCAKFPGYEV